MDGCWLAVTLGGAQIDILVVNCSLFNPTPSLSAMIINHFKMKSNIVSYNLGGMGCSAGVISISLAKELLQVLLPLLPACERHGVAVARFVLDCDDLIVYSQLGRDRKACTVSC